VSTEANKALVKRYYEEVLTKRNPALVDELFTSDYVFHYADTPPGLPAGLEGFKQFVTHFLAGYPNLRFNVGEQSVENDRVVTHVTAESSTPVGPVMTIPANSEQVAGAETITGKSTDRIVNGKIAESWLEFNIPNPLPQIEEMEGEEK